MTPPPVTFTNDVPPDMATEAWTIEGIDANGEPWSETFTSLCMPPAGALQWLGEAIHISDGRMFYKQGPSIMFVRTTLITADEARWDALIADKDRFLQMDTVGRIVDWLTDLVAAGRPIGPPHASQHSSEDAAATSTGDSPWPATLPAPPIT